MRASLAALVACAAWSSTARAESEVEAEAAKIDRTAQLSTANPPDGEPNGEPGGVKGFAPIDARVITAPTAWLPRAGSATATLGIDHRGDGTATIAYGLGGIAAAELGADTDVRGCAGCESSSAVTLGRAAFRIGAPQHAWVRGMPGLAFGVRTTFAARGHALHAPRASEAYVVASRDLGALRAHLGASAISAEVDGLRAAATLRPLAGLEIHPPIYPRSTLLCDVAWQPALVAARAPTLAWQLGVGVRYQALSWANIELAVRAREGDGLGESTVLLRVNAALPRPFRFARAR